MHYLLAPLLCGVASGIRRHLPYDLRIILSVIYCLIGHAVWFYSEAKKTKTVKWMVPIDYLGRLEGFSHESRRSARAAGGGGGANSCNQPSGLRFHQGFVAASPRSETVERSLLVVC